MRRRSAPRAPLIILLLTAVTGLIVLICLLVILLTDLARMSGTGRGHYGLRARQTGAAESVEEQAKQNEEADDTPTRRRPSSFATVTVRYVLIGDSRTRGMNLATHISASDFFDVIAESNMGYHWMMSDALPQASYLGCDNYVSLLGINDLTMIDSYLAAYRDLVAQGKNLILVTVGPVEEEYGQYAVTNAQIRRFNERLYEVEGARVIDLYAYMMEEGYHTMDGVHYTDDSYFTIEDFLLTELD